MDARESNQRPTMLWNGLSSGNRSSFLPLAAPAGGDFLAVTMPIAMRLSSQKALSFPLLQG